MTQQEALDILKMGHNVYLTGSAGSGKTYVLNQYINYLKKHEVDVGVTASTGIAATHMNGTTIHSWSGLGIRDTVSPADLDAMEEKQYLWKRFQNARVLIIDEISMMHHFRLDLVEKICKFFKRNEKPFGGIQVILCGDFFQLPPVARRGEDEAHFVYHSNAWDNMDIKVCYLHEQHRQHDADFIQVLNDIRASSVSAETLNLLTARYNKEPDTTVRATKLYTHNIDVDKINDVELEKLEGELHTYSMTERGRDHLIETIKKSCLAPGILRIKKGAHVMFVKNNTEAGYANGTLGTVVGFDFDDTPIVETASGKRITATPIEWDIQEEGRVLAGITQVPLRLAWAITVHKSQGMSLDAVEVDLSKSFERGMGYVALSRVRTLKGLKLLGLNDVALEVHEEVLGFDKTLQKESEKTRALLKQFTKTQLDAVHTKVIELLAPIKKIPKIPSHQITKHLVLAKKSLKEIAKERDLSIDTILEHLEKLKLEENVPDMKYLKLDAFTDVRFKKIAEAFSVAFKKEGDLRLGPVKNMLGSGFSYDEIRLARLFIEQH